MKFILLAFALLLGIQAHAQPITHAWIKVADPVLNPTAPNVIARHYLLWDGRTNCATGKAPRLVLAFHGRHGNAEKMATEYLIPKGCYIAAYPSGSNNVLGVIRVSGADLSWNTSSPYEKGKGWAGEAGVNDDLFITTLVDALKAQYSLTTAFAVGLSRGGMMAFHLACDTTMFSAIATVATTISDGTCSPAVHIPNLHIHGTADYLVCWDFMHSSCEQWPLAYPAVVRFWQASGKGHVLVALLGGKHAWQPTLDYDTTKKIWAFLDDASRKGVDHTN
jgi:predicted esterase